MRFAWIYVRKNRCSSNFSYPINLQARSHFAEPAVQSSRCDWSIAMTFSLTCKGHWPVVYASNLQHIFFAESSLLRTKTHGIVPRILDILILQDKTLFCALEAGDIVCWLVNQPIAKLDLFKSFDCCWICKTYAGCCYRNSATVGRLVQSPTLQSTIFFVVSTAIYVVEVYESHPLDCTASLVKHNFSASCGSEFACFHNHFFE